MIKVKILNYNFEILINYIKNYTVKRKKKIKNIKKLKNLSKLSLMFVDIEYFVEFIQLLNVDFLK